MGDGSYAALIAVWQSLKKGLPKMSSICYILEKEVGGQTNEGTGKK
jgi:hypothetical protein